MAALFLSCKRSERALEPPFVSARGSWTRRTVLDVELRGGTGPVGRGEASPLPGYSPDDADECEQALAGIERLDEHTPNTPARCVFDQVARAVPERLPAVRFALETAALDRIGQLLERPLWKLLADEDAGSDLRGAGPPSEPALCAVLPSHDASAALAAARLHLDAGIRAFKLKVGPDVLHAAQQRTLEVLRSAFGSSVELRVDANRSLARRSLLETCERLESYRPSFVEEPVDHPQPAELEMLPCGFALDESLASTHAEQLRALLGSTNCRALVLKPTLLGGFSRCLELARVGRSFDRAIVVSHALEGPVGFAACMHLARSLPAGMAHGLWPLPHQVSGRGSAASGLVDFTGPGLGALA